MISLNLVPWMRCHVSHCSTEPRVVRFNARLVHFQHSFFCHSKHTIFTNPPCVLCMACRRHGTIQFVLVRSAFSTRHDWHGHTCPAYYITPFHVTSYTPNCAAQVLSASPASHGLRGRGLRPRVSIPLDPRVPLVWRGAFLSSLRTGSYCAPAAIRSCLNLIDLTVFM